MNVPVITPKRSYDPQNEAAFREEVRRKLAGSYDRRSNLEVPFGKKLSFTSAQGQVISFGYNEDGEFTIQQNAETPFSMASIDYVSSVEAGLDGALATLTLEVEAARGGEVSLDARFSSVITAYVDADEAIVTRVEELEVSVDTPTTGLLARVSTTETAITANGVAIAGVQTEISAARDGETNLLAKITSVEGAFASADAAIASSVTALEAVVDENTADITIEATARADADSAQATLITGLQAKTNIQSNLLPNGGFAEGADGWSLSSGATIVADTQFGPVLVHEATSSLRVTASQTFPLVATQTYTLSADFSVFGTGGEASVDVICLDAGSNVLLDSANAAASFNLTFGIDRKSVTFTAPSGTTQGYARCISNGIGSPTSIQFRQLKLEAGTVATPFTDDRTARHSVARITTVESVNADQDGAIATLDSRLDAAETDIDDVTGDVTTLTAANLISRMAAVDGGSASAQTLSAVKAELEGDIAGEASARSAAVTTLEGANATQDSAIATLDSRLDAAETDIDGVQSTASNLSTRVAALDGGSASAVSLSQLNARVGGAVGSVVTNPTFSNYPASSGVPPGWSDWTSGSGGTRVTGKVGLYGFSLAGPAGASSGLLGIFACSPGRFVAEVTVEVLSGNVTGAGLWIVFRNAGAATLGSTIFSLASQPDTLGNVSASPGYALRAFRSAVLTAPSGTVDVVIYVMNHWGGHGSEASANQIAWHQVDLRAISGVDAKTSTIEAALASPDGSTALVAFEANASGVTTGFKLISVASGHTTPISQIIMSALDIILDAEAINLGSNTVYNDTHACFITTAGSYRLMIQGPFGTSDDLVIWYGLNSVTLGTETKTNGIFAFATDGKIYYGASELGVAVPQLSLTPVGLQVDLQTWPTDAQVNFTLSASGGVPPYTYAATKLVSDGYAFSSSGLVGDDFEAVMTGTSGTTRTGTETWLFSVTDDDGTVISTVGQIGLTVFG